MMIDFRGTINDTFFTRIASFQQRDTWKAELQEFRSKNGTDLSRNGDSGPLLLDVLEGYLKYEVCCYYTRHFICLLFSQLSSWLISDASRDTSGNNVALDTPKGKNIFGEFYATLNFGEVVG